MMTSVPTPRDSEAITQYIADTTQAQFGDTLRVGAGNIWDERYETVDGTMVSGLTAGLWLFVRDQPELNRHERVWVGQVLTVADYTITVIAIEAAGVSLSVALPPTRS
jgi:hypothetical protein